MKYIATVTDGSFPTNSAVIQAPIREAFAMAKAAGYDGLQLTVDRRLAHGDSLILKMTADIRRGHMLSGHCLQVGNDLFPLLCPVLYLNAHPAAASFL